MTLLPPPSAQFLLPPVADPPLPLSFLLPQFPLPPSTLQRSTNCRSGGLFVDPEASSTLQPVAIPSRDHSSSPATRSRFSFFGFDGLDSDFGALGFECSEMKSNLGRSVGVRLFSSPWCSFIRLITERLPTFERLRKGVLRQMLDNGKMVESEIDIRKLLIDNILRVVEEDNEKFLRKLRDRVDRVGIETPKIKIRYEHLSVDGDVYVGG